MADRTPSKRKLWIGIASVPILLLVLAVLMFPRGDSGRLDSEIVTLRQAGIATNYAELDKLGPTDGDNAAQTYQFGLQLGIALPIFDRNQGNIRSAQSRIVSNAHAVEATRNDLLARFAEAHGRYRANTIAATNYREKVLPSLTQAYQAIVRRYQVEPEKVGFGDVVVAQQNLAQALQTYLTVLDAQWRAVVDVANITQIDELYANPAPGK